MFYSISRFCYKVKRVNFMPITEQEIANIAGVSRGTVDRALKNRPGVSLQTKEKI